MEQKARSEAQQEVVTLRGQLLGAEESNARLLEKVTQQEEGLSILESTRLGMYLFRLRLMPWFFTVCFSVFATRFIGFRGDVDLQVLFSSEGTQSNGVGSHNVVVG